jgi:hypothetical protein
LQAYLNRSVRVLSRLFRRRFLEAFAPLDRTVPIQYGVYGAFGRCRHHGESADQLLADLGGSPTRVFGAQSEDRTLELKR